VPGVPVVDISADPAAVGAELDEICRTTGFFQITGHGIEDGVAGPAWSLATAFFDLPLADKLSVARPTADYPYGYIPLAGETLSRSAAPGRSMDDETPPDLKEVFNMGPPARPGRAFADPGEAWSYYPARDHAPLPGQMRAGPHTDYGTLTILRQDAVGGLEVLDPGGAWVGVIPVPGAFIVNLGDLMARWTNDRWRSTLHRVVDPPGSGQARRQSMPFFQNANWSAEIACLPTCLAPGEKPRYEPVLAGPHLMGKFRRSVGL
jgi:isopenicillin N synthase-like dioxygenase